MVSAYHVIYIPLAGVKYGDGIAANSITIESHPFNTFVCDDITVQNICLCWLFPYEMGKNQTILLYFVVTVIYLFIFIPFGPKAWHNPILQKQ